VNIQNVFLWLFAHADSAVEKNRPGQWLSG